MRHRSEHFCEASIGAVWILWGSIMEGVVFVFCSSPALSTTVPLKGEAKGKESVNGKGKAKR